MRLPAAKFIAFNAAAALVGVAAVAAAVHSSLVSPTAAPCTERYHSMTGFPLERAGVMLTAADLQASLGGRDVGVIDNLAIGPVKDASAPLAMTVSLRNSPVSADSRSGATFPWEPRVMQGKASVCLSYDVLFASDFDFQRGGVLPGIAGTAATEQGDKFLVRFAWRPKGLGGITVRVTENGTTRAIPVEREGFALPPGKWVKLEQETVLNTPGKSDGVLRVWADGTLVLDRTDMTYRAKSDVTISGVSADVFYTSGPDNAPTAAPKDTKVHLTPFQVRWQ